MALGGRWAHAQSERDPGSRSAPPPLDRPAPPGAAPVQAGALGGVGFPRALSVEALVVVDRIAALGVEYGAVPAITIEGVDASLWSLAGDARFFPFQGSFYLALGFGYEHLAAATSISLGRFGSVPEVFALDSWFLNPRLGFLWTWAPFALGLDAGVQIPLSSAVSSTLPIAPFPAAQHAVDALSGVLPTVDLLRIGLVL